MPIKKAAMKALRQSKTRALKNLKAKKQIKDLVKKSKALIEKKEAESATKVKAAIKAIDKAVQKKIIKENAGARKKSRLMKKLNTLSK
ncbi:MAG: 30S ribosomal protein S20 [Candidatus Buchananbacteria bacterium]|jgi:small subunit ribosomal protein S20